MQIAFRSHEFATRTRVHVGPTRSRSHPAHVVPAAAAEQQRRAPRRVGSGPFSSFDVCWDAYSCWVSSFGTFEGGLANSAIPHRNSTRHQSHRRGADEEPE